MFPPSQLIVNRQYTSTSCIVRDTSLYVAFSAGDWHIFFIIVMVFLVLSAVWVVLSLHKLQGGGGGEDCVLVQAINLKLNMVQLFCSCSWFYLYGDAVDMLDEGAWARAFWFDRLTGAIPCTGIVSCVAYIVFGLLSCLLSSHIL